jgi:hypothetical protein
VWIVGIAGLGLLSIAVAASRGALATGDAYSMGYVAGSIAFGILIGAAVVWIVNRSRRGSGRRPMSWAWSLLFACLLVALELFGGTPSRGTNASPRTSPVPANAYVHVTAPLTTSALTPADEALRAAVQDQARRAGFPDMTIARLIRADRELAGYLIVLSLGDRTGNTDDVLAGLRDGLGDKGIQPKARTIANHEVEVYEAANGNWAASWVDGPYIATVITSDEESAAILAESVLNAQRR